MRLAELGTVYRYERSGVLHGLLRVRGFTQDDAHIFCMSSQIEAEVEACIDFAYAVMKNFGFDKFEVELSDWDAKHPENYAGKPEDWARATAALANTMDRLKIPYKKMEGEAAFYGPKIDIKLIDAIGRSWQLTTVQFDFNLPARFGLEYVGDDGARHQPLMVHRALLGSVERFFGMLDRALRRSISALARAGASRNLPGQRKSDRLRQARPRNAEEPRHPRASRRSQRKTAGKNSRRANAKNSLHARCRPQRSRSRHRQRPPPQQRRPGRQAPGRPGRSPAPGIRFAFHL